ncbi:hypothetical protein M9458_055656 [Cirrhinus mrigala]|uniref:CCHC-type domain-containing protein n=1 Tax=Cirrhinus mrigala TaxID=683832 RepID=A0ABD0MKJ5_CIRMR
MQGLHTATDFALRLPFGLFDDTVEDFAQQFLAVQNQTGVIKHILPRHDSTKPSCARPFVCPSPRVPSCGPYICSAHGNTEGGNPLAGMLMALRERRSPCPRVILSPPAKRQSNPDTGNLEMGGIFVSDALPPQIRTWGMKVPPPRDQEEKLPHRRYISNCSIDPACAQAGGLVSVSQAVSLIDPDDMTPGVHPEIAVLLVKKPVPPAEMKLGFYRPNFIVANPTPHVSRHVVVNMDVFMASVDITSPFLPSEKRVTDPLWLPPITTRGSYHRSIRFISDSISHSPVPGADRRLRSIVANPFVSELCLSAACLVTLASFIGFTLFDRCLPRSSRLDSVAVIGLSTLLSLPLLTQICLFMSLTLIKLHMDPNHADSSLQKTSPPTDPATVYQLTTELYAQASVLTTHQQQLNRLTTLTEELVMMLQALRAPSAEPAISHSSLPTHTRYIPLPPQARGWLSRINLTEHLLNFLKEVFEHSADGKEVGEQLLQLCQGKNTAADYALAFRTLAAQTGWLDDPLKLLFRKGLNAELQSELACRDEGKSLAQFIDLAIRVDNLIRAHRPQRPLTSSVSTSSPPLESEPMQLGVTHISSEERERRIQKHLCLYCGLPGHMRSSCPTHPSRKTAVVSSGFRSPCIEIPVILKFGNKVVHITALVDSGAAGNFIDCDFARTHTIPLFPCASHLAVAAVDGRPLGSRQIQHTTDDLTLCAGALHNSPIRHINL